MHFPFCVRKCAYCDFCSAAATQAEMAAYCAALETEMALTAERYGSLPVDTVFLGGGTPSIVPAPLMKSVMKTLRTHFTLLPGVEFTSEANPGTLTDAWLDVIAGAGANRLSIGVQAKQERLLGIIGRIHDFPAAREAFAMARKHGFTNLNADAMFGLPTQTLEEYLATLDALAELDGTHLSAYSLILEEGTRLFDRVTGGDVTLPDEDVVADMMEAGIDRLEALGYRRYEISNFAKPGFECAHNLGYWRQKPYLGLGLSAASLLPSEDPDAAYIRRSNTTDLRAYLRLLGENRVPVAETTPVSRREAMFETVMLGLRTVAGVGYAEFEKRHGVSLPAVYGPAIETLTAEGLLLPASGAEPRLALTRRGLALQNTAMMAFMECGPDGDAPSAERPNLRKNFGQ
ncbi:MAG: radical SAM family heme chaperone HemW [Eubacteriales bacterium]|nr:radical SAM family heme chaperone HemW [Eubacteriales bacterium]